MHLAFTPNSGAHNITLLHQLVSHCQTSQAEAGQHVSLVVLCYRHSVVGEGGQQCRSCSSVKGTDAGRGKAGAPQPCPLAAPGTALCSSGRSGCLYCMLVGAPMQQLHAVVAFMHDIKCDVQNVKHAGFQKAIVCTLLCIILSPCAWPTVLYCPKVSMSTYSCQDLEAMLQYKARAFYQHHAVCTSHSTDIMQVCRAV